MGNIPVAIHNGVCVYDQKVHGGCAIGCFIPAQWYTEAIEERPAEEVFANFPEIGALFEDPESPFWGKLQLAHDSQATGGGKAWGEYLRKALEFC
jgi:hypothetical protein